MDAKSAQSDAYLDEESLADLDRWWRAANYLSVGQIYLLANPLLTEPLAPEHIKPRLLGHWGTTPGLNLLWAHTNRLIKQRDQNAIFLCGPGHGGPAAVSNAWLEGTWTETYPEVGMDLTGLERLFQQFSFPGGVPSHVAAEVPGSMHEGGELGYVLSHAYGAAMDNPDLLVVAVIGDGEAETGPLAASWHANKFVDPIHDGAVLPVLHLNGYKIANPTVLARIPRPELLELLRGYGHDPIVVEGDDPEVVHQQLARALDTAHDQITTIQQQHRGPGDGLETRPGRQPSANADQAPRWPMIVLVTPKGWTGPDVVDGVQIQGTWRAHQVPLAGMRSNPEHLAQLEAWLRSYAPEELFGADGTPLAEVCRLAPVGVRRLSANPNTNGGLLRVPLKLDGFRDHAVAVPEPGSETHEPTRELGRYLARVIEQNPTSFRIVGPDETESNRLGAVYEVTDKVFAGRIEPIDEHLAPTGRVVEVLSEHTCQGWLEGYLLTGRHGLFSCYEAFIHIVDSMVNQHAKWLKVSQQLEWRPPIASLNYLLSSHVWRQDHNGFSHQDPGFIDHVVNKKASIVRVYLPPDTNTLLSTMEHCLRSTGYINVVVAGKQPTFDWLNAEEAAAHCARGAGIWEWASNDGGDPDVVLAAAGDIPTHEALAAAAILRTELPDLRVRFVNVVDLMRLQDATEHPHGLPGPVFDTLFTADKPVIFAYHGYPWLIHRLTYRRTNHDNLHVRGYKEEGTTTTPFDMVMMNDMDRYHLVMDVIDRTPTLQSRAAGLRQRMMDARFRAKRWTREHGEDIPDVQDWSWVAALGKDRARSGIGRDTAADF